MAHPALQLRWTGQPALIDDLRRYGARETRRAEWRAIPATLLAKVLAFGSPLAAVLAVVAALLAIAAGIGAAGALSFIAPGSAYTPTVVILVTLALTLDYSLLLVRRSAAGASPRTLRNTVLMAAAVVALGFFRLTVARTMTVAATVMQSVAAAGARVRSQAGRSGDVTRHAAPVSFSITSPYTAQGVEFEGPAGNDGTADLSFLENGTFSIDGSNHPNQNIYY